MPIPFYSPINLNFLELLNARVQHLAVDPTENLYSGFVYFNTSVNRFKGYTGSGWVFLDNPAYTHPNHTGDVVSAGDGALTYNNIMPVSKGGTGQSSFTNGQLLIGNTTGNTLNKATLTQGTGLTITNGAGAITLSHTAHTGDVTGADTLTIASDAVTNTKLANMVTGSIKGRATAGTGDPEDLTASQVRALLNVADGATANVGTVTSIAAGAGLSFTTITGSGTVALGTPSTITAASTNSASGSSHTHALSITAADIGAAATSHTHTFASLTSKPTTLSGYGITDAAATSHLHTGVYEPVLPSKIGHAGKALAVNATEDGLEWVAFSSGSGGANAKFDSGTIPTTGWVASDTDYAYELAVADLNIVSTDILSIAVDVNSHDIAADCELAPAVDSYTGGYTFYANAIPASPIDYTYIAVQTTAATSVVLGEDPTDAYYGDKGKIAYDHSQTAHAPSNANYYVHPSYTTRSINTSGASVLDTFTSDAAGHVTAITTRTLTIADLGYTMQTTLTNSDTAIPTSGAVFDYVAAAFGANDAMIYKGVLDCSANPNYPAGDSGHTYKVSVAGKIGGASGPAVQFGDMLICTVDSSAAGDHATVGANWTIVQTNIDGAVVGPVSSVDNRFAAFDGTSGKLIKDSGYSYSSFSLSSHTHTFASLTSKPTTLAGYGITDASINTHTHAFADLTSKPTTLSGYGITDAATSTHNHTLDSLSNTTITSVADGELLVWDTTTSKWINQTLAEAGIATSSHTHAQLHDRSHAITSTADHTAGNWKVLYSNGSGQLVELALGTAGYVLQANGASAAPTFVQPVQPATATPLANSGSGAVGTATKYAREDHVHPIGSRKYAADVPSSTAPSFTHNFGTEDVVVSVFNKTTKAFVYCDIETTDTNTVTLGFAVAPTASAYRVVIMG